MRIKDKSKKNLLKEPDEFLNISGRILETAVKHKNKLYAGLSVVITALIVVSGVNYFLTKGERKAFDLLDAAVAQYQARSADKGPEKAYQDVKKDFETIFDQHGGKNAGKIARIIYGNICYNGQDFDRAVTCYLTALNDFKNRLFIRLTVLNNLGYAYEQKKDYQQAVHYFNKIVEEPKAVMKDEAVFKLGSLYHEMNRRDESLKAFKKIIAEYADSPYLDLAKDYVSRIH